MTVKQVNKNNNPKGKGGFAEHPEHRGTGTWDSKNTFSYQMNRFKNMTVEEFKTWAERIPEKERTMAEELAFRRLVDARKSLRDFQEVANRTEGMPQLDITSAGEKIEFPTIYKPEKKNI